MHWRSRSFQMEQFSVAQRVTPNSVVNTVDRCILKLQIEAGKMYSQFRSAIPLVQVDVGCIGRCAVSMSCVVSDDFLVQCSTAALVVRWQLSVRCQPALDFKNNLWVTTRFWALPVFTCIVIRSLGMKSCTVLDIILHLLPHSESCSAPHTDILGTFGASSLNLVSMSGVQAVYRRTRSLNMTTPRITQLMRV